MAIVADEVDQVTRVTRRAAPWSARLKETLQDQKWIKGAVNYDEDLHFSTYYLRASLSSVTEPLYPGYTSLVASFEGFTETYYLLESECRAASKEIVAKAIADPLWLPRALEKIRTRSDALERIFKPETSPALLERLSAGKLLALYERHDAANKALYLWARLPEALDRGVSYFTTYLTEHLRERGVDASECTEVFATLTEPTEPSVLSQEIAEFDAIVAHARANPAKLATPGLTSMSKAAGRARMFLDASLMRRIDEHRQKWQFLPYHGYGRRALATTEQYVARLLEQLEAPRSTKLTETRAIKTLRARARILEGLKLDRAHAALFAVYPEIGAVKLYRRYAQLKNFYFLDMLMAEIARRLDVREWVVRCMLPDEVIASLKRGRLVDPAIEQRLEGCVFAVHDGSERVLSGEAAEGLRALLRKDPSTGALTGVVASRGKVRAQCKVVIRADDCLSFPEGAILVSESTDPDLLPCIRAAGGVLTEQGGVTSHAAIICRELGVPTITGIDGLLARVKDGDWLDVDAEAGVVTIVTPAGTDSAGSSAERPAAPALRGAAEIGAKAYNLGLIRSHGFRVPEFALLDHGALQAAVTEGRSDALASLAAAALGELRLKSGERLAVRSSSVSEDRADGAAAGAFTSFLRVKPEDLAGTLQDFVAANHASRDGVAYRGSVIVQRMIEPDCSGVCLTRDLRAGSGDGVIVEMVAGINTGVTGGTLRPDRFVVDRLTGDILVEEKRCDALRGRPVDLTGLVNQLLRLETKLGGPLDIEWALVGEKLHILQARPIVVSPEE